MKKYLFMAVAAIAALSSCSSDNDVFDSEAKKALTFTATMESIGGDTRATLDATNKCAKWEEGDEIRIMAVDESRYLTEASYVASGTNGTSTTFVPATSGQEVSGIQYQAFFPSYIWDDMRSIVMPAEINETWAEGKFNMPMCALSTTTNLAFQNLCGVLAIKVNKDQLTKVKYIEISSSNRKLNGSIQPMTNSEGKLSGVALFYPVKNETYNNFKINYTTAVEIGDAGKVFYVPILPSYNLDIDLNTRTMSLVADPYKDLKILISDGSGVSKSMTTKKGVDILVERNKIYNITFKDNTPTTGTAKRTGDVDVNWVQLWAGGPKFAEYNIGTSEEKVEGITMVFEDAIKTGDDYAWGANWRTPSKDEMDELNLAAREDSKKITCKYEKVNNIWGFTFTGTEAGYTDNHVFFPGDIKNGKSDDKGGWGKYWSCTDNGSTAWLLYFSSTSWASAWQSGGKSFDFFVRPVLNEAE